MGEESRENLQESVLYLKYRPRTLDEMIGNEEVVESLRGLLAKGRERFPHCLLFHGPTGCGKTTLARIVASELGAKGSDVHEIDSADFRGIDTIRDIRRQIVYKPLESPCSVWILDECHKLTSDAQTALLKTLEDTPSHVFFVLCTTEPQKLLPTIRGRCIQYAVRPLTEEEMRRLLHRVVRAEGRRVTKEVYRQIAQDSLGSPRNALQILEQVLSVSEDRQLAVARRAAELQSQVVDLCRALLKGRPWREVAEILSGLRDQDPEQVRRAVLGYCQSILLSGDRNDNAAAVMECFLDPLYDTGFPGLVFACYSVVFGATSDE